MKHLKKKIHVKLVGRDAHTAYISLMGHRPGDKKWAKMSRVPVKGAMLNLDFDREDRLIGVEIIVWERDWLEDDRIQAGLTLDQRARSESFTEVAAPLRSEFKKSGMKGEELDSLVDAARARHQQRSRRKKS